MQHPKDGFHGGRFAGTVWPHHNGYFALFNANAAMMQDIRITIATRHILA
jgi:hypothetical protein